MSIDIRRAIRLSLVLVWLFVSGLAQAITGPETAQLLNHRYQQTVAACAGSNPAYFCSGVLIRGSEPEYPGGFWMHGRDAVTLGAERFSYVRADIGTQALAQRNGVIFSDSFTAISQGKTLDVLCAYPFVANIISTRPDYGCGLSSSAPQRLEDPSSCAALGITDATAWLRYFQQNAHQAYKQCSFSSQSPTLFKASLEAHQGLDEQWAAQPNEVLIKNWGTTQPQRIPLQGLVYDVTQTGGLLGAQKDQRDYFNATGEWLPILRMDLSDVSRAVFGFSLQDQLYIGDEVASKLNARYVDTAMACGTEAAYNCNGVLLRTMDASPDFHAWNPSPNAETKGAVSFSYLRKDLGSMSRLPWGYTQGLIFNALSAPVGHPFSVLCAYPADGASDLREDHRCGEHPKYPVVSAPCDTQDVLTVATWVAHYHSVAAAERNLHTCSFKGDQQQFALSLEMRNHFEQADLRDTQHNEISIAVWPQDIPTQIPLQAVFYLDTPTRATGLAGAQYIQRDYFRVTGKFLPIVRLQLPNPSIDNPFSYRLEDQQLTVEERPKILQASNAGEGGELVLNNVTDGATVRINGWPYIAVDQYVWLRLKGHKSDGSEHDLTIWEAPSRVTPSEFDRGYLQAPVSFDYLRELGEGSRLTVEFKVALAQNLDEAQALSFPLRTYIVR